MELNFKGNIVSVFGDHVLHDQNIFTHLRDGKKFEILDSKITGKYIYYKIQEGIFRSECDNFTHELIKSFPENSLLNLQIKLPDRCFSVYNFEYNDFIYLYYYHDAETKTLIFKTGKKIGEIDDAFPMKAGIGIHGGGFIDLETNQIIPMRKSGPNYFNNRIFRIFNPNDFSIYSTKTKNKILAFLLSIHCLIGHRFPKFLTAKILKNFNPSVFSRRVIVFLLCTRAIICQNFPKFLIFEIFDCLCDLF